MMRFTTLDTFTVVGRGEAHIIDVPDEVLQQRDPRSLVGERVCLDGRVMVVEAVEAHAVTWRPGLDALRRVSLLVKPRP